VTPPTAGPPSSQHLCRREQHTEPRGEERLHGAQARFLRDNGLTIALLSLFVLFLVGHSVAGHREYNAEQQSHGALQVDYGSYITSAHFLESVTENWESEFFQMFGYVILTAFLFQKGSAESKSPDEPEAVDRDPRRSRQRRDVPWPVRRGGLALRLYEHSLSLAFLALFLASFALHAASGAREFSAEQLEHGEPGVTALAYLGTSRFWLESLQNWQSEFLAIAAMVFLSVYLRERGSPESKPVDAPHDQTGSG